MLSEVLSTLVTQLDVDFVKVSLYFLYLDGWKYALCESVFHEFQYCDDILGPVCVLWCV